VANFGNGTVGKYDATNGATVNATFINGLNAPVGLALDGLNHLFVSDAFNNLVGEYDATTGATINANFITGLNNPLGLALDSNNHLFVANGNNNSVGEYDATTGAAINAAFINGQGLNGPTFLIFVPAVPEPGSLALVGSAAAGAAWVIRRKRLRRMRTTSSAFDVA
jgi:hypothetical protein